MVDQKIVKRYMKALSELVTEKDLAEVNSQLRGLDSLLAADDHLRLALETPILSEDQKLELLEVIRGQLGFHDTLDHFLKVLVEADRLQIISDVARDFEQFWMQERGIKKALVYSVIPLTAEQRTRLHSVLEERLKSRLVLENIIDKSLLAGIAVRVGSLSYDFSLNRRIYSLKETVLGEN